MVAGGVSENPGSSQPGSQAARQQRLGPTQLRYATDLQAQRALKLAGQLGIIPASRSKPPARGEHALARFQRIGRARPHSAAATFARALELAPAEAVEEIVGIGRINAGVDGSGQQQLFPHLRAREEETDNKRECVSE